MNAARVVLVAAAALAVAAGCSGDGDDPGAGESAPTSSAIAAPATDVTTSAPIEPSPPDFAEEFSVNGALAEIPWPEVGTSRIAFASVGDVDALTEVAGVDRPADPDGDDPWSRLVGKGNLGRGHIGAAESELVAAGLRDPAAFEDELGWSVTGISRFVEVQDPPRSYIVLATREDLAGPDGRAGDDVAVDVGEEPDLARDDGSSTSVWLLGRPLRVAADVERGLVAAASDLPPVLAWLDDLDVGQTWAGRPDLAAAARRLDEQGVYTAEIRRTGFDVGVAVDALAAENPDHADELAAAFAEVEPDYLIDEPFGVIAFGWSGPPERQQMSVVYVFDDDAGAAASVAAITELYAATGTPSSGQAAVAEVAESVAVAASGRTVTVTLDVVPGANTRQLTSIGLLADLDPVFFHR